MHWAFPSWSVSAFWRKLTSILVIGVASLIHNVTVYNLMDACYPDIITNYAHVHSQNWFCWMISYTVNWPIAPDRREPLIWLGECPALCYNPSFTWGLLNAPDCCVKAGLGESDGRGNGAWELETCWASLKAFKFIYAQKPSWLHKHNCRLTWYHGTLVYSSSSS